MVLDTIYYVLTYLMFYLVGYSLATYVPLPALDKTIFFFGSATYHAQQLDNNHKGTLSCFLMHAMYQWLFNGCYACFFLSVPAGGSTTSCAFIQRIVFDYLYEHIFSDCYFWVAIFSLSKCWPLTYNVAFDFRVFLTNCEWKWRIKFIVVTYSCSY